MEEELSATQKSLDTKEKLQQTFKDKMESLLNQKQELLDKLEEVEKKESEMAELVEQSKNSVNKKDNMYSKMLRMKEK